MNNPGATANQAGFRDNSVGSNQGLGGHNMGIGAASTSTQFNHNKQQIGAVPGNMSVVGNNKFVKPG